MFKSATLQLTGVYLLIIMLLSITFSVVVYNVSISELETALARQAELLEGVDVPLPFGIDGSRIEAVNTQLQDSNSQIRQDLHLANIAIFLVGGFVSYAVARQTLRPIEQAHEQQRRFVADASHELRTPLTALRTQFELARRKKASKKELESVIDSGIEEVDRLALLSESLLKLAKAEEGIGESKDVSAHELAVSAKASISRMAAEKNIVIEVKTEEHQVHCDEDAIVEALTILLDNAIKYSPKNTTVTIASSSSPTTISVTDQGRGIPKSAVPHIFERFYRVDAARSQRVDGYGIGLSIAEQLMCRHGGSIEVASEREAGSTFTLVFPKKRR